MKTTTVTYVCEECEEEVRLVSTDKEPVFPCDLQHYCAAHQDMEVMHPGDVNTTEQQEAGQG